MTEAPVNCLGTYDKLFDFDSHLVLSHGPDDERTDHPRERAHAVRDAHEDTGVTRRDVQVVYVEAFRKDTALLP